MSYKFGDLLGSCGTRYCGVIGCAVINLDVAIKFLLDQVLNDGLLVWVNYAILVLQGKCKHKFLEVASKNGS